MDSLETLDFFIFFLVLFLTLLSAILGHVLLRKNQTSSPEHSRFEYFLMGRKLTLPFFVATLVSTWYGGIFGVTSIAYESGIYNFISQGLFWYATYILFAFFLVKKIRSSHSYTLAQIVRHSFGPKSGYFVSLFNLLNVIPVAYSLSLGLFVQYLTGWSLLFSMSIGLAFACLYSIFGGLRSIVLSDTVQFIFMIVGIASVTIVSFVKVGDPRIVFQELPSHYFSITGGNNVSELFVWGFIALSTLVDPNFYHRALAAKSTQTAQRGILISTLLWFVIDIMTTLGGMYAKVYLPEHDSQMAYLHYSLAILPAGLKGLFLAGILSTILSTVDSYLFNALMTLEVDLFPRKKRSKFLFMSFLYLCTLALSQLFDGRIKDVWKTLGGISTSCLLLPFMFHFFFAKKEKINDNQFFTLLLSGLLGILIFKFFSIKVIEEELYIGAIFTFTPSLYFYFQKKRRK